MIVSVRALRPLLDLVADDGYRWFRTAQPVPPVGGEGAGAARSRRS